MSFLILYIVFHLVCAFGAYGYMLADIIGEIEHSCNSPLDRDLVWFSRVFSGAMSLLAGPVAAVTTVRMTSEHPSRKHGFRLS